MENIMHEVKVLRKAVNMKQYVLDEKLGVEQSNYANMENGKLITNKLPEIKKNVIGILLPMLKSKVNSIRLDLGVAVNLVKHFDKDYS